jgi:hypothetical protein
VKNITTAHTIAIAAGTKKQSRQEYAAKYPHITTTVIAPIECDEFQIDIFVASFFGGNQCVSSRAQGGNPIP